MRIATVITRLEGGAGIHALRGARAMNSAAFQMTIITGSGDRLLDEAAQAGLEVVIEPALRAPIDPGNDLRALRRLGSLFRERSFDVVHTHCAKAGALGRVAAHRAGLPRTVHTYHGFPFHEFQLAPRRQAYVAIERRLGRITDLALCVGTGVAGGGGGGGGGGPGGVYPPATASPRGGWLGRGRRRGRRAPRPPRTRWRAAGP